MSFPWCSSKLNENLHLMGGEEIIVKFAGEEESWCQQLKVVLSVPASEEKMSQPNNGPNMKQTNMKQLVVDHHKLKCTIQRVVKAA